jgi:hypothetical protein
MKWKRKGGCLRAEEHGVVFKIEETTLSFRNPDGGWEKCAENSEVEGAKERAETIADLYRQIAEHDAAQLTLRRQAAQRLADMTPQQKSVRTLWEIWQRFSNMERFAARKLRPDLGYVFDVFDKRLEEDAHAAGG